MPRKTYKQLQELLAETLHREGMLIVQVNERNEKLKSLEKTIETKGETLKALLATDAEKRKAIEDDKKKRDDARERVMPEIANAYMAIIDTRFLLSEAEFEIDALKKKALRERITASLSDAKKRLETIGQDELFKKESFPMSPWLTSALGMALGGAIAYMAVRLFRKEEPAAPPPEAK